MATKGKTAEVQDGSKKRGRPPLTKLGFRPVRDFTRRLSGKHTVELLAGILDHMVTDSAQAGYLVSPELKQAVTEMQAAAQASDWKSLAILSQCAGFVIGAKPAKGRADLFWEDATRYNMEKGGDVPLKDILAFVGLHAAARADLIHMALPEGAVTRYPVPAMDAESETVKAIEKSRTLATKRASK